VEIADTGKRYLIINGGFVIEIHRLSMVIPPPPLMSPVMNFVIFTGYPGKEVW